VVLTGYRAVWAIEGTGLGSFVGRAREVYGAWGRYTNEGMKS